MLATSIRGKRGSAGLRGLVLLSVVIAAVCLQAQGNPAEARFQAHASTADQRSLRGVIAVRGERTIAAENAQRLFVPASVLKLVVTSAALHYLGPDHRRLTTVAATGPIDQGVVKGDLVLQGAGDPTWNRRFYPKDPRQPLHDLARQLRRKGARRVAGDLILDASRFTGPAQSPNHTAEDRSLWYGAPCSAAAVDENAVLVRIAPGARVGQPGRLLADDPLLGIENQILTVGGEWQGKGTVGFLPGTNGRSLLVKGEYPVSEPAYSVKVSIPDPDFYTVEAFIQALRQEGISVAGWSRVSPVRVQTVGPEPLAAIQSAPLSALLAPILGRSHNWYAEMLLRILALEVGGTGRLDAGLRVERDFLTRTVGVPADAFFLDDASGLSRSNLIAPEAVVTLLEYVLRQPWRDVYVSALPASPHGTLKHWPELAGLRAKTGTLQHTVALAGYVNQQGRTPLAFAAFVNHWPGERYQARTSITELLRSWAR